MRAARIVALIAALRPAAPDGARERSPYDATLASLCAQTGSGIAPRAEHALPTLTQVGATSMRVEAAGTYGTPLALYVTDTDDTIVALAADMSSATLVLPADVMAQPQRLKPYAVYRSTPGGCDTRAGTPVANWQAVIDTFDYDAAGGAHRGDESLLAAAAPTIARDVSTGGALVTMARFPALYVPLLYVKCENTAVVGLHRFAREDWPSKAGSANFSAKFADMPESCTAVQACAAMPAQARLRHMCPTARLVLRSDARHPQENCGGFPQRCSPSLSTWALFASRLESAETPTKVADAEDLVHVAWDEHGAAGRLAVRARESCVGIRLYLRAAGGSALRDNSPRLIAEGEVVAYAAADEVHLTGSRLSRLGARTELRAYRACGVPSDGARADTNRAATHPAVTYADLDVDVAALRGAAEAARAAQTRAAPRPPAAKMRAASSQPAPRVDPAAHLGGNLGSGRPGPRPGPKPGQAHGVSRRAGLLFASAAAIATAVGAALTYAACRRGCTSVRYLLLTKGRYVRAAKAEGDAPTDSHAAATLSPDDIRYASPVHSPHESDATCHSSALSLSSAHLTPEIARRKASPALRVV